MSFRCLLIGDGSLLVECGTLLLDRGHRIEAVVTTNDSIADWAREVEAEVVQPGAGSVDSLAGKKFDWIFSIANLSLIPAALWQSATKGAVNFHDSLLPRYAGLNAPAWALLAGEASHGVTWHAISEGIDEGDIYLQRPIDIDEDETALTLNAKCFEAGIASFAELIDQVEAGTTRPLAQTPDKQTYCGRNDRPDAAATLDFTRSTAEIDRIVRALNFGRGYPNPLALPKVRTKSGVYFVRGLEKSATMADAAAGTVVAAGEDGVTV
jgi:methionyl-tRNA formyltransferase